MQLTASTAVGSVDKITALASRHLDTYSFDGTNYIPEVKASSNPSWIALDLLTGDSNPKPLTMNRVDLRSFYEFSQYCDTVKHGSPRFACNFTWDADSTVLQRVQEVLLSARASITIRNNKYAVVWEQYPTAAVQRFTPDNTWGYSSVLTFPEVPDALRVSFIDPSIDYQMNDLDVYNDGITAVTARTFERITLPLCTNKAQAWRSGRYYLRQGIVRREVVSIQTDVENLICERGDRVHLSSDIVNPFSNHWQQLTVATVTAGSLTFTPTAITNLVGGADILLKYDDHHGQVVTTSHLGSFVDATTTINHPDITVADFLVGSTIYAINEAALADIHYLVKSITPSADLTATLTLVPLKRAELIGIDDKNLPTYT